jgi:hypothetical protein
MSEHPEGTIADAGEAVQRKINQASEPRIRSPRSFETTRLPQRSLLWESATSSRLAEAVRAIGEQWRAEGLRRPHRIATPCWLRCNRS